MENIKYYRKLKRISQKDLADKLGMTREYIVFLESNNCHSIGTKAAEKICNYFEIDVFDLFGIDIFKIIPKTKEQYEKVISFLEKEKEKNGN